jgi:hypothetical protein
MTKNRRYTAWGPVRGCCGHEHWSPEAARRCAERDGKDVKAQGQNCYSDRRVRVLADDDHVDREEDGSLSWYQGQDGPGSDLPVEGS